MTSEQAGAVRGWTKGTMALSVLLVTGSAMHFFGGNVADPDLWAHLQYGRMIWEGHGLPSVEVFSYTAPGAPFYDHEWLTDFVFAGVIDALGPAGLVIGKVLLLSAMLLLLLDTARVLRDLFAEGRALHPLGVALVTILALAVIGPGATFRAQLFTMAFLALEGALLARVDRRIAASRGRGVTEPAVPGPILAIPPLLLVWANLHGGFLVGLGMFGLWGLSAAWGEWTSWREGRSGAEVARRLAALGAVGLAALLAPIVNPYGIELYTYLARTLDMHGQISEWHPVGLLSGEFLRFKLLVLATAACAAILAPARGLVPVPRSSLRPFAWRVAFYAVAAFLAFRHQRHTVLFAIAATPFVVVGAEQARRLFVERWPVLRPRRTVLATLATGAAAVALFQVGTWARQIHDHGLTIRYGRLDYPADAVEFLKTHGFEGNVAMPFEWGAYAITKLAPESRVFIDGRFEAVYPPDVIEDYFAFMNGTPGWERLLDEYPTDVVVVQRWREIHPRLFERDDLVYVYSDPAALVFVRPGPRTNDALERLARVDDRHDFPRVATYFP